MTPEVVGALTEQQRAVALRVLAEEERSRRHIAVSLSGAHAYGFPSPDSDLDVKAVHIDPTAELLGFPRVPKPAERLEVVDGVEVDYTSNELGHVLLGVLKGNGNYIERFLSGYLMAWAPSVHELKPLVQASLSKRIARHYLGFATQQRMEWEKGDHASAKKLLYVLRTSLTGTHALLRGEIVTDVTRLLETYGFGEALELVERKRHGEKSELSEALRKKWAARIPDAFSQLERAASQSQLPDEAPNADELERWLVAQRLSTLMTTQPLFGR
ncbi:MAG: DNA polymerase beta superfamily protein [Myxococcaceae bacterium]